MKPPTYDWTCHKCGTANQAHADRCASCGFPAIASAWEIDPKGCAEQERKEAEISQNLWLFLPEGVIAGFVGLISPIWAIQLLVGGHFWAATTIVGGTIACSYGFIWAMQNKLKFVAYLAIATFLLLALTVYDSIRP